MPDQPTARRRFRMLRWSLFGLALVGLGFLLHDWLSPWPRCTIRFQSSFSFAAISPDGHFIATGTPPNPFLGFLGGMPPNPFRFGNSGGAVNPFQVWDTRSGNLAGTYFKVGCAWNHVFSPKFRYLAASEGNPDAGQEASFHLVNLQTRDHKVLPLKNISMEQAFFSPQEKYVIVIEESSFLLVETSTGKAVRILDGSVIRGFVPDDSLLVYESEIGGGVDLHILNTRTGRVVKKLKNTKQGPVRSRDHVLSPAGRTLAANVADGLHLMDLTTFQMRRLRPATELNSKMLFSPNGTTLAVFSRIGEVEFWDVASGKHQPGNFGKLRDCQADPSSGVFSPDSRFLILSCFAQ